MRSLLPSLPLLCAAAAVSLLSGCNQAELFRLGGLVQEDFSNDAEILFVIDNSTSMLQESADLGVNFDGFIDRLIDPTGDGSELNGLADAVDNYILSVSDRGAVIDFQLGITTTDITEAAEFGDLVSFPGSERVLAKGEPDLALKFRQNLLCESTCFPEAPNGGLPVASDVGRDDYTCGDPLDSDELFAEYMDCTCGESAWKGNCGTGDEEHLEAVFLAMCRGIDPNTESQTDLLLLDACEDKTPFQRASHAGTNADFYREGSVVIPVIVTDAGDGSRRLPTGEAGVGEYDSLFDQFGRRMAWAVIGPTVEGCRTAGAENPQPWQISRYEHFVDKTNGLYIDITTGTSDDCQVTDFGEALDQLGQLLNQLLEIFPLQSIPDQETLLVFVDNKSVEQSLEERDEEGNVVYGSGWTYLAAENAVQFHGDAVPDYRQEVRIYYKPLEGMPRELPF